MNNNTSKVWHSRSKIIVYASAVIISMIRAFILFAEHSGWGILGVINGLAGAVALEGVSVYTYTGIISKSWKTKRHRNWLMSGTVISIAMSIVVQISEYWLRSPDVSWTLLGFVAPTSASFAMLFLIAIEFVETSEDSSVHAMVVQREPEKAGDSVKRVTKTRTIKEEVSVEGDSGPVNNATYRVVTSEPVMQLPDETLDERIARLFRSGASKSEIVRQITADSGVGRSTVYAKLNKIQIQNNL